MSLKSLFLMAAPVAVLCSCGAQYPRQARYELAESYPQAKARTDQYFISQRSEFGLWTNRNRGEVYEARPDAETHYVFSSWAPDIGEHAAYSARLVKNGTGSSLEVVETPNKRLLYDSPRAVSGSKLGPLKKFDQWVQESLSVRSREIGTDKSRGRMYPPAGPGFFTPRFGG